jgi:hypothetical protein
MSYLIIHWCSFLFRSAPLMRDTRPRLWNSIKVNHVLPQYLFNQRSGPTTVKCRYRTRCSKFTRFPCIPTREDVGRHCTVVINRVVPREVDHPIHNNQLSDRPSRSHDGTWDELTAWATQKTGRVPIPIILTFYLVTDVFHRIYSLLPSCLSPLKSWDGIFIKGGGL